MFSEWIADVRLRENKKLMESHEVEVVFRAQGSVGMLDLVLDLENDLRTYQKGVAEGKFQALTEVAHG